MKCDHMVAIKSHVVGFKIVETMQKKPRSGEYATGECDLNYHG